MCIRVFLADDHAVVRDGLKMLLEARADIQVVGSVGDGRTALRLIPELAPEIVIMDISMPGLDGIETTIQLQKICPDARIIILSVHSSSVHILRALRAGVRGYLVKESAGDEVVDAVYAVRAGDYYFSRAITEKVTNDLLEKGEGSSGIPLLELLSAREREVLCLLAEGRTNQEIAAELFISVKTVETYRSRMMQKLGLRDFASLVKFAICHGLTTLGENGLQG
ncbi:MAG: response regulator [Syntrophobacteraceae bacterium]